MTASNEPRPTETDDTQHEPDGPMPQDWCEGCDCDYFREACGGLGV